MSGKPTYAAVTANQDQPQSNNGNSSKQSQQPFEAPPPYSSGPSLPSSVPHQTTLPPHAHAHQIESGYSTPQPPHQGGWSPPPSQQVAKARAMRRFWVAFLWAWGIWIMIGLIIGGGVSDMERAPAGRHGHWDKHGRWREDSGGWLRLGTGAASGTVEDDWASRSLGESGEEVLVTSVAQ